MLYIKLRMEVSLPYRTGKKRDFISFLRYKLCNWVLWNVRRVSAESPLPRKDRLCSTTPVITGFGYVNPLISIAFRLRLDPRFGPGRAPPSCTQKCRGEWVQPTECC